MVLPPHRGTGSLDAQLDAQEVRPRRAAIEPAEPAILQGTPRRRIPAVVLVAAVVTVWVIALVLLVVYGLSWRSDPMEPVPIR